MVISMEKWGKGMLAAEIERITQFIRKFVLAEERVVVPVSGGIDSDIVARLCCRSIGKAHVRLFIVLQSDMEPKFLQNARGLSKDLDVPLAEMHLENMNLELMKSLEKGETEKIFRTDRMLDPAKAKCSVRSAVISSYQDKGFLVAGTTNRTEKELGFFLTFGDNLAHFKPIAHLYKSQLPELAKYLGTSDDVINQAPSAGFWQGETDMEDLAYWIVNDGPIVYPKKFTDAEVERVDYIKGLLEQEEIDQILKLYHENVQKEKIISQSKFPQDVVMGLIHIVEKAKLLKNREIMAELEGKQ